ncbi:MAG: GNAT family N-acetyltransferase [Acidimicrobiales bacterium]
MLATERLRLRAFEPGDVDAIASLLGDATAMRYVGDGEPHDRSAAEDKMRESRASLEANGTGALAVVLSATDEVIGYCGIEIGEDTGELELNYALSPSVWGNGFAFEAARAVVDYADTFLEVLLATADPRNSASVRILGRLGFEHTHTAYDIHGLPTAFFRRTRPET